MEHLNPSTPEINLEAWIENQQPIIIRSHHLSHKIYSGGSPYSTTAGVLNSDVLEIGTADHITLESRVSHTDIMTQLKDRFPTLSDDYPVRISNWRDMICHKDAIHCDSNTVGASDTGYLLVFKKVLDTLGEAYQYQEFQLPIKSDNNVQNNRLVLEISITKAQYLKLKEYVETNNDELFRMLSAIEESFEEYYESDMPLDHSSIGRFEDIISQFNLPKV